MLLQGKKIIFLSLYIFQTTLHFRLITLSNRYIKINDNGAFLFCSLCDGKKQIIFFVYFQNSQQLKRNVKAVLTTMLVLGTYIIGWMPATIYSLIACNNCIYNIKSVRPYIIVQNKPKTHFHSTRPTHVTTLNKYLSHNHLFYFVNRLFIIILFC